MEDIVALEKKLAEVIRKDGYTATRRTKEKINSLLRENTHLTSGVRASLINELESDLTQYEEGDPVPLEERAKQLNGELPFHHSEQIKHNSSSEGYVKDAISFFEEYLDKANKPESKIEDLDKTLKAILENTPRDEQEGLLIHQAALRVQNRHMYDNVPGYITHVLECLKGEREYEFKIKIEGNRISFCSVNPLHG
jgi:hypothetical protein